MSDQKPIHLYDQSEQLLASYTLEEREKAFNYAAELEEMGIEVTIKEPSLPETLINSLGATSTDRATLQKEIDEEIDSHGSDCETSCLPQ